MSGSIYNFDFSGYSAGATNVNNWAITPGISGVIRRISFSVRLSSSSASDNGTYGMLYLCSGTSGIGSYSGAGTNPHQGNVGVSNMQWARCFTVYSALASTVTPPEVSVEEVNISTTASSTVNFVLISRVGDTVSGVAAFSLVWDLITNQNMPVVVENSLTTSITGTPAVTISGTPTVTATISGTPNVAITGTPTVTATISGTPNVAIIGTPAVTATISGTPAVSISGTPSVTATISGTPNVSATFPSTQSVNVSNTPNVSVANTPSVNVANSPTVSISNTPTVTVSGTANVAVTNTPSVSATFPTPQSVVVTGSLPSITGTVTVSNMPLP